MATVAFIALMSISDSATAKAALEVATHERANLEQLLACGGGGNGAERKPARPGTKHHE